MQSAREALVQLREGNHRFVTGVRAPLVSAIMSGAQEPKAAILTCSDSRVAPELLFDQGHGDLFVVRVGGNVATPTQLGSLEFGVEQFGIRLVVIMGHSGCGAVMATLLQELEQERDTGSPNLDAIVERIRPAVRAALEVGERHEPTALLAQAVRNNMHNSVRSTREESQLLDHYAEAEGLVIVGAEYSLETGRVEFFE